MKSLERTFKEILENFERHLKDFSEKYPETSSKLKIKDKDPQVDRLINSFALMAASLQQEVNNKAHKELKSLIYLLDNNKYYATLEPKGILEGKSKSNIFLKEGTVATSYDKGLLATFTLIRGVYLSSLTIEEEVLVDINNKDYLKVKLKDDVKDLKSIDFFANKDILWSLFRERKKIKALLEFRGESHEVDIEWLISGHLSSAILFPEENQFIRVSNIPLMDVDNFSLLIPLSEKLSSNNNLKINYFPIVNRFKNYGDPIEYKKEGEFIINGGINTVISKVDKVYYQSDLYEEIPTLDKSFYGWFSINERIHLRLKGEGTVFTELTCFNKVLPLEGITIDNLNIPLRWVINPTPPREFDSIEELEKIISVYWSSNIKAQDKLSNIIKMVKTISNNEGNYFSKIEEIFKLKMVKEGNYMLPQVGSFLSCSTDSDNLILLRMIGESLNVNCDSFIDISFNTPRGYYVFSQT